MVSTKFIYYTLNIDAAQIAPSSLKKSHLSSFPPTQHGGPNPTYHAICVALCAEG